MDTPENQDACPPEALGGQLLRNDLELAAGQLLPLLRVVTRTIAVERAELDILIREAETKEHRRAAYIARDKAVYRLGGAFEPITALGLDDVTLTGFLATGPEAILLLVRQAVTRPSMDVAEQLTELFRSREGLVLRRLGVWVRWQYLAALYHAETEAFLNSKRGKDPAQAWRRGEVTAKQRYIVGEICHLLQLEPHTFANCGEAFEWIKKMGGNPRFNEAPPAIDLAKLATPWR